MSEHRCIGLRQLQKRAKLRMETLQEDDIDMSWLEDTSDHQDRDDSLTFIPIQSQSDTDAAALDTQVIGESCSSRSVMPCSKVIIVPTRMSEMFSDQESSTSSSDLDSESEQESLVHCLRRWYCSSRVNLSQLKNLLSELKHFHPDLPSDPRTIVSTAVSTEVRSLSNGEYVHIGIQQRMVRRAQSGIQPDTNRLGIDINIDGLPISKSSIVDVWPILGRCAQFVDSRPFVIGIFCGSRKPDPLDLFLKDFIFEVSVLKKEGILINDVLFEIFINCYICDAPARAYLKCTKSHSGYNACERCMQDGEYDGMKVCFESKSSTLRTDESFDMRLDENHHTGVSPLILLETKFITQFPFCSMHLIWLGVTKRFLLYITQRAPPGAKLRARDTNEISSLLSGLDEFIPSEFARKPRSLSVVGRWKATELRLFQLYISIVVFKSVLSQELYSLFLLFYMAIRIVSCAQLVKKPSYIDFAEQLLQNFVSHSAHKSVFGPGFISYNVHCLLHLCDDVRNYGEIDLFSAFPFENYLGAMKRMVRSGARVLQQLVRRLAETDFLYELEKAPSTLFSPSGYSGPNEYKKLSNSTFILTKKPKDSFFRVQNGNGIAQVQKIMKIDGKIFVIADVSDDIGDFFESPIQSRKLGIMKLGNWSRTNVLLSLNDIERKLMVLPCGNDRIAIEMLHTCREVWEMILAKCLLKCVTCCVYLKFSCRSIGSQVADILNAHSLFLSDMKAFVILEFPPPDESGMLEVAVAPSCWLVLDENQCWWPQHLKSDLAIQKAVCDQLNPGKGFEKWPFNEILHEYDSYLDAVKGVRKGVNTTDLDSAKEDDCVKSSRGRRVFRKQLFTSDRDKSDSLPKPSIKTPPVLQFHGSDCEEGTQSSDLLSTTLSTKKAQVDPTTSKVMVSQKQLQFPVKRTSQEILSLSNMPKKKIQRNKSRKKQSTVKSLEQETLSSPRTTTSQSSRKSHHKNCTSYVDISIEELYSSKTVQKSLTKLSQLNNKDDPPTSSKILVSPTSAQPLSTYIISGQMFNIPNFTNQSSHEKSPTISIVSSSSIKKGTQSKKAESQSSTKSTSSIVRSPSRQASSNSLNKCVSSSSSDGDFHPPESSYLLSSHSQCSLASDCSDDDISHHNIENIDSFIQDKNISDHDIESIHSHVQDENIYDLNVKKIDSHFQNISQEEHLSTVSDGESEDNNNNTSESSVKIIKQLSGLDYLKEIYRSINMLKDIQHNQNIILQEVLQRLRNKGVLVEHPSSMPDIPLNTITDAQKLEKQLTSPACTEYLVQKLANEGGATVQECVDRILKKLMKRRVRALYSFKGRKHKGKTQKLAFSDTKMFQVVKSNLIDLE